MEANQETIIIDLLEEKISPFLIVLFGSSVKGNATPSSDIDIAYLSNHSPLDHYEIFMIAQELATVLNKDVDLIDLKQASTVFQAQVLHTGKTIFCSDSYEKARFELLVYKMYSKLNEERLPILEKIDESGSIYEK